MSPAVSLLQTHSYEQRSLHTALTSLLQPLGGMAAFVKPGDRVLLKPNLLTAGRPRQEVTTRPEVVYCVAQMVQAAAGHPFLGDSPAMGSARGVAKANGLLPVAEVLNLPIVEFQGQSYPSAGEQLSHLWLSKEAMNADVVINLPKLKSHQQPVLTLGVKNLFGCVPGKAKARWHLEIGQTPHRFAEMLVETAKMIQPDLTILDGVIAHEGNGPSDRQPRCLGLLAASADVFALDRVCVDILNVDPLIVPTVAAAIKLGLCPDLQAIDFPRLTPEDVRVFNWQLADRMVPIYFSLPRVIASTLKDLSIRLIKEPLSNITH